MKLLFFHNTLAEYRIGFFNELSKICDLKIVFTDFDIGENVYKNKIDKDRIEFEYDILSGNKRGRIQKSIKLIGDYKPSWIIIPALDDMYSVAISKKLMKYSHSKGIKVGFFWEKWCWYYSDMPLVRCIKEFAQRTLVSPIVKKCDALMAPGIKTAEYLKSCGVGDKKIFKVHDASEIAQHECLDIRRKYGISEDSRIILYLGRIVKYKALDILVQAYSILPEEYRNKSWLVIGGDGPERNECERIVSEKKLQHVVFCGNISPDERYSYYKNSSVFVLPSISYKGHIEAWGLSLNEAAQVGNILISTCAVGAAYELINKKNGFMVRENSVLELSKALLEADSNELKLSAEREDARLAELYNYRKMAEDIVHAIEGIGSCICF